jgi:transposase
MLSMENRVEIEVLHRQGKGIREIARITGLARNTVRDVVKGRSDGQYGPRKPRPTKLDEHKEYLAARIAQAGDDRLSATVLLRELVERGYDGGITQLKDHLRTIRPAPEPEPVVRFETPPGKQLQIDFVVLRRGELPLRAFTAELGYSRYPFVEFTDNERTETLLGCLERALLYFGGVPEQILCDNPKTIVLKRDAYGDGRHRLNPLLLDFSKHYGFKVALCAPYRAQTKGKLERFHRYFRSSFFVPLQSQLGIPVDVATANREVRPWLHDVAASRVHATLKERPIDRFERERPALRPLPLQYGGLRKAMSTPLTVSFPVPVESLQHPLSVYETLAMEVAQ